MADERRETALAGSGAGLPVRQSRGRRRLRAPVLGLAGLLAAAIAWHLPGQAVMLALETPGQGTGYLEVEPPYQVELRFRHSVEGCPVREVFDVSAGDFLLLFTEFSSTGAGLPADGPGFRWSGNAYHVDGDGRRFSSLQVQAYPFTGHELVVGEDIHPLSDDPAAGGRLVRLRVRRLPAWLAKLYGALVH